jgi:ribonuclease P/MRP protein subunit POP5
MVRIKHRYLLINILYPNHQPSKSTPPQPEEPLPWTVEFQRPSSDRLDSKLLNRMIRDGVAELFGDYGAGMVAGSLQSASTPLSDPPRHAIADPRDNSQILLLGNKYSHHPGRTSALQNGLGGSILRHQAAQTHR